MDTTIKEILVAEERAKAIAAQAAEGAERIVANARKAALDVVTVTEQEIRLQRERAIADQRSHIKEQKRALLERQEQETAVQVAKARKNIPAAAEFLVTKVRTFEKHA